MKSQTRFNKGIMDIKDKSDVIIIPRELQQFSPNTSQSKSYTKDVSNCDNEGALKVQQTNLIVGGTHTNFQKYSNNIVNTSSANKSLYNSHNSSNYNGSTIKLNNQISSHQPQLKQQESFKNLTNNIKKPKDPTSQNINPIVKQEISPLKKLDLLIKKKAVVVSSHVSSSKASISLAGTGAMNSNNVSTRINPVSSVTCTQENQSSQLLETNNLINIKLSQEALRLRRNDENIFLNAPKLNSLLSSEYFSPGKAVQATQDTRDSTSNSSSVKRHKHTKSGDLPKEQSFKSNIKNPEDLHFFYINMIQANKEFMDKFDLQDD